MKSREIPAKTPPPRHYGFSATGSLIESEGPVQNEVTAFFHELLGWVRDELISPAQVIERLADRPERLRALFPTGTLLRWASLDQYALWPCADGGSSFLQALIPRHFAPKAWADKCRQAATLHGYHPPAHPGAVPEAAANLLGLPQDRSEGPDPGPRQDQP